MLTLALVGGTYAFLYRKTLINLLTKKININIGE